MLFLLSPAKSLDFESPLPETAHTLPAFGARAAQLVKLLRRKSPAEIAALMELSDALARLNVKRFKAWRRNFSAGHARPAVLAFDGDVYGGLAARTLSTDDLDWAQQHVCILSGLYGVLRPLDLMQPYRLEMGRPLATEQGQTLYDYWRAEIARYLRQRLRRDASPVVVNLASQEYFKAVDRKALGARVVECVFEEQRSGQYKVISFMAKRARGLMARYAVTRRVLTPGALAGFSEEGYAFDAAVSTFERLVFRRKAA